MMTIKRIRRLMELHGLTQAKVAARAGIQQSRVSEFLSGKVDSRISTWRKIEAAVKAGSSTGNAVSSVENVKK